MGFFDKMKAANGINLGNVESPDFPCCVIVPRKGVPVIISGALNIKMTDYPIENKNVEEFYLIGCGANWAKYYIRFKDGKSAIITQPVIMEKGGAKMASIERFVKVKMPKTNVGGGGTLVQSAPTKKASVEQASSVQIAKTETELPVEKQIKENANPKEEKPAAKTVRSIDDLDIDDPVTVIEDVTIDGKMIKKGTQGVLANVILSSGGRIYTIKLDNGESINISGEYLGV